MRASRALAPLLGLCLSLLGLPGSARAAERSELEKSVAAEALSRLGWEEEPDPWGKTIEAIEIYALPVFDERDPVPDFVNVFHVTSQDYVVRRQLLFEVGQVASRQRTEETERNLRDTRQLSLANVVVARGTQPGTVRMLVLVKDVWSLRLNSNIGLGADGLEYLLLNPSEENLAGTQSSVGLLYRYEPFRQTFGGRYVQPRLGGTRYWLAGEGAVITNQATGAAEGSSGLFYFELPLYSLRSRFSYGTRVAWLTEITRRTIGTELRDFQYESPTGEVEQIPWQYGTERLAADYFATRSWGLLSKRDLSFGLEFDHRRYRPPELDAYSPEAQAAFLEQAVPVSDRRFSPYAQLRLYEGRFHRVLDLELLGLQEDFRLGYEVLTRFFAASEALGSSRDLVGTTVGLSYSWPFGNGLLRASLENRLVVASQNRNEGILSWSGRVASPILGPGRLHVDLDGAARYENYLNVAPFALGGNGRLRGFRFNEFQGENIVAWNVEYRTQSFDLLSAQVGFAAFYDAGDTPNEWSSIDLHQSAGVGVRVLFPQADRAVLRVDYGMPLDADYDYRGGAVYVTFGQAFSLPGLTRPSVVAGLSPF